VGGAVPSPSTENFCICYIKMVSFYAFLVVLIDTVLFKKGHPNEKGGCPDTLDTPWIRP